MLKKEILVSGLHCRSCELILEDKTKEIDKVKDAKFSFRQGRGEIYYEQEPDWNQIDKAIVEAGYSLTSKNNNPTQPNSKKWLDWLVAGAIIIVLLGIYKLSGLDKGFKIDAESLTWPIVILIGLSAGFSSCLALVGGLVLGVAGSYNQKHPEASSSQKFIPHLFFNLGRFIGFMILGGLLGWIGSAFQFSSLALGILTILIGLVLLLMGLQILNIFPILEKIKIILPKHFGRKLNKQKNNNYNHLGAMGLGALTFFLPCGFTQAMQIYAVGTGSFIGGALVMGLFAIGTTAGLLSIGGISAIASGNFQRRFFKVAGLILIVFAVFNINNGWHLAGFNIPKSPTQKIDRVKDVKNLDPNVKIENGVQVVRMVEDSYGYTPASFTVYKNMPVRWEIDAQEPYSCAASILMSSMNIRKNLKAGVNIIEFTPTQVGRLNFSCSMGMYRGYFNVIAK